MSDAPYCKNKNCYMHTDNEGEECEICKRETEKFEYQSLRESHDRLLVALRSFVGCQHLVSTEINERGHNWTECYLDEVLPIAKEAIKKAKNINGKQP